MRHYMWIFWRCTDIKATTGSETRYTYCGIDTALRAVETSTKKVVIHEHGEVWKQQLEKVMVTDQVGHVKPH